MYCHDECHAVVTVLLERNTHYQSDHGESCAVVKEHTACPQRSTRMLCCWDHDESYAVAKECTMFQETCSYSDHDGSHAVAKEHTLERSMYWYSDHDAVVNEHTTFLERSTHCYDSNHDDSNYDGSNHDDSNHDESNHDGSIHDDSTHDDSNHDDSYAVAKENTRSRSKIASQNRMETDYAYLPQSVTRYCHQNLSLCSYRSMSSCRRCCCDCFLNHGILNHKTPMNDIETNDETEEEEEENDVSHQNDVCFSLQNPTRSRESRNVFSSSLL